MQEEVDDLVLGAFFSLAKVKGLIRNSASSSAERIWLSSLETSRGAPGARLLKPAEALVEALLVDFGHGTVPFSIWLVARRSSTLTKSVPVAISPS